jgi:hypothetical protein
MAILGAEWLDERRGGRKIGIAAILCDRSRDSICMFCTIYTMILRPPGQVQSPLETLHYGAGFPRLYHELKSYYNILYLLLQPHAKMNWTGGQLRRHSARQGILSKTQNQKFGKSRQQASNAPRQPSTFRGVPDPNVGGDDRFDGDTTCRDGQMTGGEAQNQSVVLLTVHRRWPRPTLYPLPRQTPSSRVVALTLNSSRVSARVCLHWPSLFLLTALVVWIT